MPAFRRWAAVAALTAVTALTVAACGGDGSSQATGTTTTTTPAATTSTTTGPGTTVEPTTTADATPVIEVRVVGGKPQGGVRRERVKLGEAVVLRVVADVADEVHVHGYDRKADVAPGKPAQIRFTADVPGVWEVELERRRQKLLELEVR